MTPPEPVRASRGEGRALPHTTPPTTGRRLAGIAALTGITAGLLVAPMSPALAAANPGQAIANDYGQTDVEVAAEITAAVNANGRVQATAAAAAAAHRVLLARWAAEGKARAAYLAAVRSKVASRIVKTRKTYLSAHALSVKAAAAAKSTAATSAATRAAVTAQVKALHYRPQDGTFAGPIQNYLVPTTPKFSFEPLQVQISVYGGHVSDVRVITQAPVSSDSNSYNVMSLSTLCLEAMAAHDTANVAAVSGASLSSEAFQQSLTAALVAAGFKA